MRMQCTHLIVPGMVSVSLLKAQSPLRRARTMAMHNAARARLVIATAVCRTLRARAQQVRLVLGKTLELSPELCAPGGRLAQVGKLDLDSTGHVTQCVNDVTAITVYVHPKFANSTQVAMFVGDGGGSGKVSCEHLEVWKLAAAPLSKADTP